MTTIKYENALADPRMLMLTRDAPLSFRARSAFEYRLPRSYNSEIPVRYVLDLVQLTEWDLRGCLDIGQRTVAAITSWLDDLGLTLGTHVLLPDGMRDIPREALDEVHAAHVAAGRIVGGKVILDTAGNYIQAQFRVAKALLTEAGLQPEQVRQLAANPELSAELLTLVEKLPVIEKKVGGKIEAGILGKEADRLITGLRLLCPHTPDGGPS